MIHLFPKLVASAVLACLAALTLPATAQEAEGHEGHMMTGDAGMGMGMGTGDQSPASLAYMAANDAMHSSMAIPFTGNADADFIRSMIPHHEGAVQMARIVLQYGSDPEVKKLAEAVIAAQEAEITWMQDWLAQNGG